MQVTCPVCGYAITRHKHPKDNSEVSQLVLIVNHIEVTHLDEIRKRRQAVDKTS